MSKGHALLATAVRVLVLSAMLWACTPPRSTEASLRPESADDRARLQENCNLTARICTRCHDFARVLLVKFDRPARWQKMVSRMRYMPASGITEDDARSATRCLVYRAFGRRGLDELEAELPATKEPRP